MEISLFEEQKYCNNGSPGWKCSGSEKRTLRKGKIIAMTFSLNGEGAIIEQGWLFHIGLLEKFNQISVIVSIKK